MSTLATLPCTCTGRKTTQRLLSQAIDQVVSQVMHCQWLLTVPPLKIVRGDINLAVWYVNTSTGADLSRWFKPFPFYQPLVTSSIHLAASVLFLYFVLTMITTTKHLQTIVTLDRLQIPLFFNTASNQIHNALLVFPTGNITCMNISVVASIYQFASVLKLYRNE